MAYSKKKGKTIQRNHGFASQKRKIVCIIFDNGGLEWVSFQYECPKPLPKKIKDQKLFPSKGKMFKFYFVYVKDSIRRIPKPEMIFLWKKWDKVLMHCIAMQT